MVTDLENEIWIPILGYESFYSVSNKGRIKAHTKEWHWNRNNKCQHSTKKTEEQILSPGITAGYQRVSLSKNCKAINKLVHRLVAIAFISNPENKPQVNQRTELKQIIYWKTWSGLLNQKMLNTLML